MNFCKLTRLSQCSGFPSKSMRSMFASVQRIMVSSSSISLWSTQVCVRRFVSQSSQSRPKLWIIGVYYIIKWYLHYSWTALCCYFSFDFHSMAPRKGQKQQGGEQNISLGPQVHVVFQNTWNFVWDKFFEPFL